MSATPKATIPRIPDGLSRELKEVLEPLKELVEVRSGRRPNAAAQFPAALGTGLPTPLASTATLAEVITYGNQLNVQIGNVINFCNQLRTLLLS